MTKIGCTDCGQVYARKTAVPMQCRPFSEYVVPCEYAVGGYEFTGDEPPFDV